MYLEQIKKSGGNTRRIIDAFSGLNRMNNGNKNEFYELKNAFVNQDGSLETKNSVPVIKSNVNGNSFMTVFEEGNINVYSFADDGFYKNSERLGYVWGRSAGGLDCYDQNGNLISEYNTSSENAKLIRAKDEFIIASPQMIYCKKHGFFKQQLEWYFFDTGSNCHTHNLAIGTNSIINDYFNFAVNGEKFRIEIYDAVRDSTAEKFTMTDLIFEKDDVMFLEYYKDIKKVRFEAVGPLQEGNSYYCVKIVKKIPEFSDVAYVYNRLWGVCKNRIYASKVESVFDFTAVENEPLKGYWADTQSTGESFAAIMQSGSRITAFKPSSTYEVYGIIPPYTIKTAVDGYGCSSAASIAGVAGITMLQCMEGIYAYGGRKFAKTDQLLGDLFDRSLRAAATGLANNYFLLGQDRVFIYDYYRRIWTSAYFGSDVKPLYAQTYNGSVLVLCSDKKIRVVYGDVPKGMTEEETENLNFEMITRFFGENEFRGRYLIKLQLRMKALGDAEFKISMAVDNKPFKQLCVQKNYSGLSYYNIPVFANSSNEFMIKIEGKGRVVITALEVLEEMGGKGT